jgi:hypothetical protein
MLPAALSTARCANLPAWAKYALLLVALALLAGCASKWDTPSHKWYQGTMDDEDRSFFIDSFTRR